MVEQKSPIKVGSDVQIAVPGRSAVGPMTRRFNIVEKLKIIDKYNDSLNISDTCRWVRAEFNRSTFDRKSLRRWFLGSKSFVKRD